MVSSRKRGRQEVEAIEAPAPVLKEPGLLERMRNMWQFANLAQWIFLFGKVVKLEEDLDIEVRLVAIRWINQQADTDNYHRNLRWNA